MGSWGTRRIMFAATVAIGAAACLFPSLGGLSEGSDASTADASNGDVSSGDGRTDATADGLADVHVSPDAAWMLVDTEVNFSGSGNPVSVSSSNVSPGDLVIIGCDMAASAGDITLSGFPSTTLNPQALGPDRFPSSLDGGGVQTIVWWGLVDQSDGGAFGFTATPQGPNGFTDCTINVYRGGTTAASLVASKITSGTGMGLVTCGPVDTVPGGVAYYITVRWGCVGTPQQTFVQLQDPEGNPNGDIVPTDGGPVQSLMNDCNSSTGDWVCATLSISP